MRLSEEARQAILETVRAECGDGAETRLFGSRLDDNARGGDVDLHVLLPQSLPNPAWSAAMLAAKLERRLGGRKVDVRLLTPQMERQSIDVVAFEEGVRL